MKISTLSALAVITALSASSAFAAQGTQNPVPPTTDPNVHLDGPKHGGWKPHPITKDEWMKRQAEKFDKIDTDHNGTISPEEMKAHHEQMRAKMQDWKAKHPGGPGHDDHGPGPGGPGPDGDPM